MNVNSMLLSRRGNLPRPVADWDFGDFSKIQAGATSVDVAGWTGENLKAAVTPLFVTQTTAAAQPVWQQGYDPTGSDLITNGTFDTDLSGWTVSNPSFITWDAGTQACYFKDAANANADIRQDILTIGKQYLVSIEIKDYVSGGMEAFNTPSQVSFDITGNGTYSIILNSTQTKLQLKRVNSAGAYDFKVDNISVFEAVENNSKSHIVFDGSDYLTAGADNALTDLLFAEAGNPFTFICKYDITSSSGYLFSIADSNSSDRQFGVFLNGAVDWGFYLRGTRTSIAVSQMPTSGVFAITWDGSIAKAYVDGVFIQSLTAGSAAKLTGVPLILGARTEGAGQSFHVEGKIFNTLIYPTALNAVEIASKTASLA